MTWSVGGEKVALEDHAELDAGAGADAGEVDGGCAVDDVGVLDYGCALVVGVVAQAVDCVVEGWVVWESGAQRVVVEVWGMPVGEAVATLMVEVTSTVGTSPISTMVVVAVFVVVSVSVLQAC